MRKSPTKRVHETNNVYNPLFVKIVTELRDDAEREKRRSEMTRYSKILKALRMYKTELKSGQDCIKLKSCGPKTCALLDKKLEEYKKSGHQLNNHVTSEDEDEGPGAKRAKKSDGEESDDAGSETEKSGSQSSHSHAEDDEGKAKTASEPAGARKKIKAKRTKK